MKSSLLSVSKCDDVRISSLRLLTNNSLHDKISTISCTRELQLPFCVDVHTEDELNTSSIHSFYLSGIFRSSCVLIILTCSYFHFRFVVLISPLCRKIKTILSMLKTSLCSCMCIFQMLFPWTIHAVNKSLTF